MVRVVEFSIARVGVDQGGQGWSESALRGWGVRVGRILSEKGQGRSVKVEFGLARVGDGWGGLILSGKG